MFTYYKVNIVGIPDEFRILWDLIENKSSNAAVTEKYSD